MRGYLAHLRATSPGHQGWPISSQTLHGCARAIKAFLRWSVREGLVAERVTRRRDCPAGSRRSSPSSPGPDTAPA